MPLRNRPPDGVLAGSALDMASAMRNTIMLGVSLTKPRAWAAAYPAEFRLVVSHGRIAATLRRFLGRDVSARSRRHDCV